MSNCCVVCLFDMSVMCYLMRCWSQYYCGDEGCLMDLEG